MLECGRHARLLDCTPPHSNAYVYGYRYWRNGYGLETGAGLCHLLDVVYRTEIVLIVARQSQNLIYKSFKSISHKN